MPNFDLDSYQPVADRIKLFWADHPEGSITTELIQTEPTIIIKALVYRDIKDMNPSASDYAEEVPGKGFVNQTSALENCSTSATGRALANLGYATTKERASREEMEKVSRATTSDDDKQLMRDAIEDLNEQEKEKLRTWMRSRGLVIDRLDASDFKSVVDEIANLVALRAPEKPKPKKSKKDTEGQEGVEKARAALRGVKETQENLAAVGIETEIVETQELL